MASTTVTGVSTAWKQYEFTLKTGKVQASSTNHLTLTVGHAGTRSKVNVCSLTYENILQSGSIRLKLLVDHTQHQLRSAI